MTFKTFIIAVAAVAALIGAALIAVPSVQELPGLLTATGLPRS